MAAYVEDPEFNLKAINTVATDYAGAISKSDPVEIALVRKLDWRIMPTLWAMYFMNYVSLFFFGSKYGT